MSTIHKIPEINITLSTREVNGGFIKYKDWYQKGNIIDKIRMLWNWYWNHSETISWLAFLNTPAKVRW